MIGKELAAWVALARPAGWYPYLGLPVLGSVMADAPISDCWRPLAWCLLYLPAIFAFNGACDAGTDAGSKNPIAAGRLDLRRARTGSALALVVAALALPMLGARWGLGAALLCLGTAYSLPGYGLKRLPMVGVLANLGMFLPLALLGGGSGAAGLLLPLALPATASELLHQAVDRDEDEASGTRSTAAWLGPRRTAGVASTLLLMTPFAFLSAPGPLAALGWVAVLGASVVAAAPTTSRSPNGFARWRRRVRAAWMAGCLGLLASAI